MNETTVKRGRGRPANFPNVATIARLYNLPVTTVAAITDEAKRRNVPVGVFVDSLLSRAMKEIARKRK